MHVWTVNATMNAVTVYTNRDFGDRSKTFDRDAPHVGDDLNDKISSVPEGPRSRR